MVSTVIREGAVNLRMMICTAHSQPLVFFLFLDDCITNPRREVAFLTACGSVGSRGGPGHDAIPAAGD